jgi:hypothetical protein
MVMHWSNKNLIRIKIERRLIMKKGLIVLIAALSIIVGGLTYTMASIGNCLEVKESQQSEESGFCGFVQKYLPTIIGNDDPFWG